MNVSIKNVFSLIAFGALLCNPFPPYLEALEQSPSAISEKSGKLPKNKQVGMVLSLKGKVVIKRSKGTETLARLTTPIFIGDKIETAYQSFVQIEFIDRSKINLMGSSDVTIDDYYFDGTKGSRFKVSIKDGAMGFMAGKIAKICPENYKVETETATIGIRGSSGELETSSGEIEGVEAGLKVMKTGGIGLTVDPADPNAEPVEDILQSGMGVAFAAGKFEKMEFKDSILSTFQHSGEQKFNQERKGETSQPVVSSQEMKSGSSNPAAEPLLSSSSDQPAEEEFGSSPETFEGADVETPEVVEVEMGADSDFGVTEAISEEIGSLNDNFVEDLRDSIVEDVQETLLQNTALVESEAVVEPTLEFQEIAEVNEDFDEAEELAGAAAQFDEVEESVKIELVIDDGIEEKTTEVKQVELDGSSNKWIELLNLYIERSKEMQN